MQEIVIPEDEYQRHFNKWQHHWSHWGKWKLLWRG